MNTFDYLEVSVRLDPFTEEMAEILTAELSELPFDSFVTEEPFLKCYIQTSEYRPSDVKVILSGYPAAVEFKAAPVQGRNWNQAWEQEFKPIVVDGKVTIKAQFNKDVPRTRFNIWIDPQMAFGTGYHQTTYMMMQRMLGLESAIRGHSVVDMGCGTAVLAILAAKMGARKVFAVDIDAVAARSAWGNAHWNRVGSKVETYVRSLRRGGRLLLSGFFVADVPAIREAAEALGLHFEGSSEREDWACLEFAKA